MNTLEQAAIYRAECALQRLAVELLILIDGNAMSQQQQVTLDRSELERVINDAAAESVAARAALDRHRRQKGIRA